MPFIERENRRVLFVHIPRTGGTSVESWMRTLGELRLFSIGLPMALKCTPQHLRYSDISALLGEGFFDHAFTIVRNPFHRIESAYRLRCQIQKAGPFGATEPFSPWLERVLHQRQSQPFALDNHLRPQWEFAGSGVEVFKFEDGIGRIIARLADGLGWPAPEATPHELHAPHPEPIHWDRVDRLRVQEAFRLDFETFGYDPDGE